MPPLGGPPVGAAPVRVLYVWDADYPWDVRTEKICRSLTQAGCDVAIIARNAAWKPEREGLPEGTVFRMPRWRIFGRRIDRASSFPAFFNPRWIAHIAAGMRGHRPDVVIVRDLPLCPTAIWVARRFGTPVVLDMAENYAEMIRDVWAAGRKKPLDFLVRNPEIIAAVERYVLPRLDHIITVVDESSDRLAALGVPWDRLSVVSNTPPASRADAVCTEPARAPRGAEEALHLTYLGLMEVPRGINDVLDALAILRGEGRRIDLCLIGDGRDRMLFEARAAVLGLGPDAVRFMGALPNAEALRLVGASDVGLVPHHAYASWNTTIPNKLFDYMAAGLPVVTSDAVPAARIVRGAGAGVVYRSGDAVDLATQLRPLFDLATRERMALAGRQAVRKTYNWERDVDVLLHVVRSAGRPLRAAGVQVQQPTWPSSRL